jgi:hypothetical protein
MTADSATLSWPWAKNEPTGTVAPQPHQHSPVGITRSWEPVLDGILEDMPRSIAKKRPSTWFNQNPNEEGLQMAAWMKTFREGNPVSPRKFPDDRPAIGGQSTFFEPLSRNADGSPKLTRGGEPVGKPGWKTGDLIGGYWNGSYEVGEVWEVTAEPGLCHVENWGWQTPVQLRAVRRPGASLDELAIRPMSLARQLRLRLRPDQERLLKVALGL